MKQYSHPEPVKRICFIIALLLPLSGLSVSAQVSHFMTIAFSKTSLDNSENWKPWSDWLPVTDGRLILDRDNMRATLDIDSWNTHINMQIDSTAEGVAGQDISLFTFYCSSLTADYHRKQYNLEILAYRKPGVAEIQYQYTIYLTDSSSSAKFLARFKEADEQSVEK